jgi:plasmid maintenance system antidote protein VapI
MEPTTMLRVKDASALREHARTIGMTTAKLAATVGLSDQRIWKLYSGDQDRLTADKAILIADALGEAVSTFFELPDAAELKRLKLA